MPKVAKEAMATEEEAEGEEGFATAAAVIAKSFESNSPEADSSAGGVIVAVAEEEEPIVDAEEILWSLRV